MSVLLYEDSFKQLTLGENFDDLSVVSAKNKNDIFFAWYRHTDRYSDALSEKNMIYTAYVSKKFLSPHIMIWLIGTVNIIPPTKEVMKKYT